jgi:hypothetical protein
VQRRRKDEFARHLNLCASAPWREASRLSQGAIAWPARGNVQNLKRFVKWVRRPCSERLTFGVFSASPAQRGGVMRTLDHAKTYEQFVKKIARSFCEWYGLCQ